MIQNLRNNLKTLENLKKVISKNAEQQIRHEATTSQRSFEKNMFDDCVNTVKTITTDQIIKIEIEKCANTLIDYSKDFDTIKW